jgi:hypothetical protein
VAAVSGLQPGSRVTLAPAFDSDGVEIDQLGDCEAVVVEVGSGDVLVSLKGTGAEWWVTKRRLRVRAGEV